MKKLKTLLLSAVIGATVAILNQVIAGPVALIDLPDKVHEAVTVKSSMGLVGDIERTVEGDETNYEVGFKEGEVERRLTFSSEGKVTWTQVFEADLPAAVRQILNAEFKDVKPVGFYRVTEDEEPYYDLEIPAGSSTNSLSVAENGRWWSLEIEVADVPAPVRATIERELGLGNYDSISKTKEDGKFFYEAEGTRGAHLDIAPDGKVISREDEVTLEQVTPAARKTISARFNATQITSITRHSENNDVTFEVEANQNGKTINLTVGHGGRIRPQSAQ